jgi:hypothetical protein
MRSIETPPFNRVEAAARSDLVAVSSRPIVHKPPARGGGHPPADKQAAVIIPPYEGASPLIGEELIQMVHQFLASNRFKVLSTIVFT